MGYPEHRRTGHGTQGPKVLAQVSDVPAASGPLALPSRVPIDEEVDKNPANPYGESKLIIERILRWAHEVLRVLPVGEIEPRTEMTPAEREAMLERLPKKMQERIRRSREK